MKYEDVTTTYIDDDDVPWIPYVPYSSIVYIKYLKLNPISGESITLLKVPAGITLPRHHHTGTVVVYTIQGSWKYCEHDWIARTGGVVYETAATSHTPQAIPDTGDVITLNVVQGELLYLDDDDQVIAVESWRTGMQRYLDYCKAHGITPRDITGFTE